MPNHYVCMVEMLNLPADETDQFARGRRAAGGFDEPFDLQRRSHDTSQDCDRSTGCWYRGGRLRHLGSQQLRPRICPDRTGDQGRQGGDGHELQHIRGPLTSFKEFTRLFSSPPKSPRGYVEDPTTPSRLPKTPAPHGRFLFVGFSFSGLAASFATPVTGVYPGAPS